MQLYKQVITGLALLPNLLWPVQAGDWSMAIPAAAKDYKQNENVEGAGIACGTNVDGVFSFQQKINNLWETKGIETTTSFSIGGVPCWAQILDPADYGHPGNVWPVSPWLPGTPPTIRSADYKVQIYHNSLEIARINCRAVP